MALKKTDQQIADELDALRSRFFTLESKKRHMNWEHREAVADEHETIADRVAIIYRTQRQRAKRGTKPA